MEPDLVATQLLSYRTTGSVEELHDFVYDNLLTIRCDANLMEAAATTTANKEGDVEGIIVLLLVFPPVHRDVVVPNVYNRVARDYPHLLLTPLMKIIA